jgi:hypothetical protein
MNVLLEELGYVTRRSGEVHRESSVCYVATGGSLHFLFRLTINPAEYTGEGRSGAGDIDLERYREIQSRIVKELRTAKLKSSGKHLFDDMKLADEPTEGKADIRVLAAKVIMEMPPENEMVAVADREVPARRMLTYHPWSGRHRGRGIVLAKGPSIKHRYSGAWMIDDPYTRIFRYTHGIFAAMDMFAAPFRRLHLTDEVTTLDVTPTLLYLSGLPVAEDMDGRILMECIEADFSGANPVKTVPTYRMGEILNLEGDPAEEAKIKERLKALGYIQ